MVVLNLPENKAFSQSAITNIKTSTETTQLSSQSTSGKCQTEQGPSLLTGKKEHTAFNSITLLFY